MSIFIDVHMDGGVTDEGGAFTGLECVHVLVHLDCDGGGILVHGVAPLHHAIEAFSEGRGGSLTSGLLNGLAGVLAGAVVLAVVAVAGKLWRMVRPVR